MRLPTHQLSAREREVVQGVVDGLSNSQIAERHGTAMNTVRTQLHAIFGKLGLANRAALAVWALRNGVAK